MIFGKNRGGRADLADLPEALHELEDEQDAGEWCSVHHVPDRGLVPVQQELALQLILACQADHGGEQT